MVSVERTEESTKKYDVLDFKAITDDAEVERACEEIISLQKEARGDVEPRTKEEMADFLRQDLVFCVKRKDGTLVASAYLEPVKDTLFLGGMSSREKGTLMAPLMQALDRFLDKNIVLRTKYALGKKFFVPNGFKTADVATLRDNHQAIHEAIVAKLPSGKTTDDLNPTLGTFFREKQVSNDQ